ncbi:MAG: class I SAM-dependent methyltransferase [Roseiflexaceae bacterium]
MEAPTTRTYAEFAMVFDAIGLANAGLRALQYSAQHGFLGERRGQALDLGCGNGLAVIWLASQGWQVIGRDRSLAMLSIAIGRSRDAQQAIRFEQADLRDPINGRFDLITCLGDTLSECYLLGDFDQIMRQAAAALNPAGRLVFDLRTPEAFADWDAHDEVLYDAGGLLVYAQRDFHPQTDLATCRYVWFTREDVRWWRAEEIHTLRCHRPEQVLHAINTSGMVLVESIDWEDRRILVCERP